MVGSMVAMLKDARQEGYAVPSFCVWNAESARAVLDEADTSNSPVILMAGPVELELTSPVHLARIVRDYATDVRVPVVLHLDHGDTPERVKACINAGFNSVMLDYSKRTLAENIAVNYALTFRKDDRDA